jgi:DNA polymerase-3 subunit delta
MAKSRTKVPPILNVSQDISSGKILPVYYFYGEDTFSIDSIIKELEKKIEPFLTSDFDKEVIYAGEKNLSDIITIASSFPFGSSKKFILVKEFEKITNKKNLISYIDSPADFTYIVFIHNGTISNLDSEPYKALLKKNYLYEAVELKDDYLIDWVVDYTRKKNKIIPVEIASFLVEMVGNDRNLIESQLEKIFIFLGDKKEVTIENIEALSTQLREYTVFDLQDALGEKAKQKSFKIAFNLLDNGTEPTTIIFMVTKYFTGLLRLNELRAAKKPDYEISKVVGTYYKYLYKYDNARKLYSDNELMNISRALLNADMLVKTTSTDNKSIITLLLTEIFNAENGKNFN